MEKTRIVISDEYFLELYNKGLTQSEIVEETGISAPQASRRCKKLGLDPKKNTKKNFNKINEEEFLRLYFERTTDANMAKLFECSETKIKCFRESLGLKKVDRKHFTDDEFLKLYNQGFSDKQISEVYNTSKDYVRQRRNKLSLPINKEIIEINKLTEEEFQVILGTVLGDTHLYKRYENGNCAGTCNHCVDQEELIFTKYKYLKNISAEPRLINKYDERLKNPEYKQWYWYINSNPALNDVYHMFYKDKVKYINEDLIEKIEPLGLAIWYMDDGSKYQDYGGYLLCTHGFSIEDVQILQKILLKKFNIPTSINSKNGLYILKEGRDTFKKLIEPYIIDSMRYKL